MYDIFRLKEDQIEKSSCVFVLDSGCFFHLTFH